MPRVPNYQQDNGWVSPNEAQLRAPDVSSGLGEIANGAARLGASMQDFAKVEYEINATAVSQAQAKLVSAQAALRFGSTDAQGNFTPGYSQIQGGAAGSVPVGGGATAPLAQAYMQKFQGAADTIALTLGNDDQRAMFRRTVDQMAPAWLNEVSRHQAEQFNVWQQQVDKETGAAAVNNIVSAAGTPAFNSVYVDNVGTIRRAIDRQLASQGFVQLGTDENGQRTRSFSSPEQESVFNQASKEAFGAGYEQISDALVAAHRAPFALQLLQAHKDELPAITYDRLHQSVSQAAMGTNALDQTDAVLAKVWTDRSVAPDLEKVDAELRAINHDDAPQLAASRAEVNSRLGNWTYEHDQAEKHAEQAAANDIAGGKSIGYMQTRPYWGKLNGEQRLDVIGRATQFSDAALGRTQTAAQRSGDLDPDIVAYGIAAHGLSEPQARAVAALAIGEGGGIDVTNPTNGGHGAYGLFQIRDSGGLQDMRREYGDHPTKQQQIDFFLTHYAKGNSAFWNSSNEAAAFHALAIGQGAGDGTAGIIQRGLAALTQHHGQEDAIQADRWIADPGTIGPLTPQNTQAIVNAVGQHLGEKVIKARQTFENQITRASMPSAQELGAVFSALDIDPKSPDAAYQRANIRDAAQQAIAHESLRNGRPVTDAAERQEIIQKATAITVQTYNTFDRLWGYSSANPFTLDHDHLSDVVVPDSEKSRIIGALRRQNIPPTQANVQTAFLRSLGIHR